MKMVRGAFGGALALLVLVVVGYGVMNSKASAQRKLTRDEMARLFGWQPTPSPVAAVPCDGCYLETVGAQCWYDDPCYCVTVPFGQNDASCPSVSEDTYDFNTLHEWRAKKDEEDKNDKIKYKFAKACYDVRSCTGGTVMVNKSCSDLDGECVDAAGAKCKPCNPGNTVLQVVTLEEKACDNCPKK